MASFLRNKWIVRISVVGTAGGLVYMLTGRRHSKYDIPIDLSGKTFIVTGANFGIGYDVTKQLAAKNATVIMACRDRDRCVEARREVVLQTKNNNVYCRQCDLSNFDSVRSFVAKLERNKEPIKVDCLINNAAVIAKERRVNKNGIEECLAVNHLGAFLLTALLLDKLLKQQTPSRIVYVTTDLINSKGAKIDYADLNFSTGKYDHMKAYKRSKLAQAICAKELAVRLYSKGVSHVTVSVADPGTTNTRLNRELGFSNFYARPIMYVWRTAMGVKSVDNSSHSVLYAAVEPTEEGKTGSFYNISKPYFSLGRPQLADEKWPADVFDLEQRKLLWLTSEKWCGLQEQMAKLAASRTATTSSAKEIQQPVEAGQSAQQGWWPSWLRLW